MNHVIHIKFQEVIGQIKPVHGVNNGPLSGSETKDLSRYFRLGGIPRSFRIFLRIRRMLAAMISGTRMCTWRRRMRPGQGLISPGNQHRTHEAQG